MQAYYNNIPLGKEEFVSQDSVKTRMQEMFGDGADEVRIRMRGRGITRSFIDAKDRKRKRKLQRQARKASR